MFKLQTTKSDIDHFIALNQLQLSRLLTFIDFVENFSIGFIKFLILLIKKFVFYVM